MQLIGRPRTYHPDRPATSTERSRAFVQQRRDELATLRHKLARKVYHESKRTTWGTPWHVFDPYNDVFAFTLDVCASHENRKCARYFSPAEDGLAQDWGHEICWMNPPFGRHIGLWMQKAYESAQAGPRSVAWCLHAQGRAGGMPGCWAKVRSGTARGASCLRVPPIPQALMLWRSSTDLPAPPRRGRSPV
jgi:DNA N-6-adenine-methyltransferase (Dam)